MPWQTIKSTGKPTGKSTGRGVVTKLLAGLGQLKPKNGCSPFMPLTNSMVCRGKLAQIPLWLLVHAMGLITI